MNISKMATADVVVTNNGGPALVATPENLPAGSADMMAAAISSETHSGSRASFFWLDKSDRGVDEEDASVVVKSMSEKLFEASRSISAINLVSFTVSRLLSLGYEIPWGMRVMALVPQIGGATFEEDDSGVLVILPVEDDGAGDYLAKIFGSFGGAFTEGDIKNEIRRHADRNGRAASTSTYDDAFLSALPLFSPMSHRYLGRWMRPGTVPIVVSVDQEGGVAGLSVISWGSRSSRLTLGVTTDRIPEEFSSDERKAAISLSGVELTPDVEWCGRMSPVDLGLFPGPMSTDPSPGTPSEVFVMAGNGFVHFGTVMEGDRGEVYGSVWVAEEVGGSPEFRTKRIPGFTKEEVMSHVKKRQETLGASLFEAVSWSGIEDGWSRDYDVKSMGFWKNDEFWRLARFLGDPTPLSSPPVDPYKDLLKMLVKTMVGNAP